MAFVPALISLGIAAGGGAIASRGVKKARKKEKRELERVRGLQRGFQRRELELEEEALEARREAFEQQQKLAERRFENQLVNQGIAQSSIGVEARQRFRGELGRERRQFERAQERIGIQEERLDVGLLLEDIGSDLQRAFDQARQISGVSNVAALAPLIPGLFGGGAPAGIPAVTGAAAGAAGVQAAQTAAAGITPGLLSFSPQPVLGPVQGLGRFQ